MFVILHNPQDADSRAFIDAHADDPDVEAVIDWTDEDARDAWVADGGTMAVSAFPSVVYRRPELDAIANMPDDLDSYRADPAAYVGPTHPERGIRLAGPEVVDLRASLDDDGEVVRPGIDKARERAVRHDSAAAVTWAEAVAAVDPAAAVAEADAAAPFVAALADLPDDELPVVAARAAHAERLAAARAGAPIAPRSRSELGVAPVPWP